jgi:hypothetical protein
MKVTLTAADLLMIDEIYSRRHDDDDDDDEGSMLILQDCLLMMNRPSRDFSGEKQCTKANKEVETKHEIM